MTSPSVPTYGPCDPWPVRWICDVSCESPTVTAQAVQFATEVVWGLSGRQFGYCTVTLRPCRKVCNEFPWPASFPDWVQWPGSAWVNPTLLAGQWFNVLCSQGCVGDCSCQSLSEVVLPAPVAEITQVKIDGVVLAPSEYILYDGRTLTRAGIDEWPRCNDLRYADTEVGTWSITARYGQAVPEGGAWAVGELACEFIRARNGEDCRLSRQVTQLIRQNVTIEFPSITEMVKEHQTGLYLVDLFVMTWNPARLTRRSGTYSVDGSLHRRPS